MTEPRAMRENNYPYADTVAAEMLRGGIRRAAEDRKVSLRQMARDLGYKQATVLSHMANGRTPVPLERAPDIAAVVGIPSNEFLRAAVAQRNPAAMHMLETTPGVAGGPAQDRMHFVTQLTHLANRQLEDLSEEQKGVLLEVVLDPHPARRWLSPAELPTVLQLRRLRPSLSQAGLNSQDTQAIERALATEA